MKKNSISIRLLSLILVLIMAFSMVPIVSIAAQSDKVTVRIEGTGSSVLLAPTMVSVANGATAEDALRAALTVGGHIPSDANVLSMPGGFINKLLGVSADTVNYTTYWMYTLNNEIANYGVNQQKVYNGDELVFYFVENSANKYAYFDKADVSIQTGTNFSLKLKTYGYDSNYNPVVSNCSGATLVTNPDDGGTYTTNASGDVTLSFSTAGTYIISAKKEISGVNTLDAAYCKVVVTDTVPAAINRLDNLSLSAGGSSLTLSPEFIPHTLNYRISLPYEKNSIIITPTATLGSIQINADNVVSGGNKTVNLMVGTNVIPITIDSTTTYKLIVNRASKVLAADKQTKISNILQACSQSFVNTTDYWQILGMAGYNKGAAVNSSAAVLAAVTEAKKASPSATTLGMWVATLNSLGYNCTSINDPSGGIINLVEKLYNMSNANLDAWTGNYIYWLLAINSGNYSIPGGAVQTVDGVITKLINTQDPDGGWYYTWGGTSYADMDTAAMAISALAPYYNTKPLAKTAVDKAIVWLETKQLATGGYGNTNTDAMVIIALTSMGIDPDGDSRFIKSGKSIVDDMLSYKTSNNFFGYSDTNFDEFATKQGFCAILAYSEYLKNTNIGYNIYKSGVPSGAVTVSNISILSNPTKTSYLLNESFDPSGMSLQVNYSNASVSTILVTSNMISGYDFSTKGTKTLSVTYGGLSKTFNVNVTDGSAPEIPVVQTKTVTISVIGDSSRGTILSSRSITADKEASVFNILKTALSSAGIELDYAGSETSAYIVGIGGLKQYDKGANSGWKYYVNGTAPNVGSGMYKPKNGDIIEFKFTTDYTKDDDYIELEEKEKDEEEKQEQNLQTPLDETQINEILTSFKDTETVSTWAKQHMAKAVKLGIMKGDSDNRLNSQSNITRAEFCAVLIRALNIDITDDKDSYFNDVPSEAWYNVYIKKAADLGIVKGTGDKLFSPDAPITRQDMAVMVAAAFNLSIKDNKASFGDNYEIAGYASDAVLMVTSNKIMQGDGQNFNPTAQTTREMAATVLIRYLETLN